MGSFRSMPVSRVLSWVIIYLGLWFPTASSDTPGALPTGRRRTSVLTPYLVLHQEGFTLTLWVSPPPVGSYPTVAPLPFTRRYIFCGTFPGVAPAGSYPAPCPAVPGLSSGIRKYPRSPGILQINYNTLHDNCHQK